MNNKQNPELPPVSPRLQEAFEQVQEAINALFGLTRDPRNKRKLIPKVSVALVHDRGSDDAVVVDGWLYLMETEYEEETPSLKGTVKNKRQGWSLTYMTYDPGVRYYKDGSGQPPSWDENDCDPAVVPTIWRAVETFAKMIIRNHINNMAEADSYKKMPEQEDW